jgi:hypothetical protein
MRLFEVFSYFAVIYNIEFLLLCSIGNVVQIHSD